MATPFAEQLNVLLKYSALNHQEALSSALSLASSTVSGWKERGLPPARQQAVAQAFGIDGAWFDEPIERFRALVIARFRPVDLAREGMESAHIRFIAPEHRVAVPGHWPRRPRLAVNAQMVLVIDVPAIARQHTPALHDIVVLSVGARGTVLLRPSALSLAPLEVTCALQVPESGPPLLIDAVGSNQFVLALCLLQPLPPDTHRVLRERSGSYLDDADIADLWQRLEPMRARALFLKHTVDVVE